MQSLFSSTATTLGAKRSIDKTQPIVRTYPYLLGDTMNFSHVCYAGGFSSKTPFKKTSALERSEFEDLEVILLSIDKSHSCL